MEYGCAKRLLGEQWVDFQRSYLADNPLATTLEILHGFIQHFGLVNGGSKPVISQICEVCHERISILEDGQVIPHNGTSLVKGSGCLMGEMDGVFNIDGLSAIAQSHDGLSVYL